MILAHRLVRLIEFHADELASTLLQSVLESDMTKSYRQVPASELRARVREIYEHVGEWLLGRSTLDIDERYQEIGARRASQNVPLSEVLWVIVLTKENLWRCLQSESVVDPSLEIPAQLEFMRLLDHFFDRALHAAAVGYARSVAPAVQRAAQAD